MFGPGSVIQYFMINHYSFAILLMEKRELVALLYLSSWCLWLNFTTFECFDQRKFCLFFPFEITVVVVVFHHYLNANCNKYDSLSGN